MKLTVHHQRTAIKIEPNLIMRGTVLPIQYGELAPKTQDMLGVYLDRIPMLAIDELYAGKICAALNRQHPRDLFDVLCLFDRGNGLTPGMRHVLVVYLACDARPIHELIAPHFLDFASTFHQNFVRMAEETVTIDQLKSVRGYLVQTLQSSLTLPERRFLVSVAEGEPQWQNMRFPNDECEPYDKIETPGYGHPTASDAYDLRQFNRQINIALKLSPNVTFTPK